MAKMDRERLLEFIQLIVEGSPSSIAAIHQLLQLASILEMQEETRDLAETVKEAAEDHPEIRELVQSSPLSEEALQTAHRRAEERRRRQAEMADRC